MRWIAGALLFPAMLAVAGCGSGSETDAGGFTPGQLRAGREALSLLGQTAVWTAASEVTGTNGNVPTHCTFHVVTRKPLTFELLITWAPGSTEGTATNRRFAWLRATIGPAGLRSGYGFHLGYAPTERQLEAQFGHAFEKPAESCLIEQSRSFAILSRDSRAAG